MAPFIATDEVFTLELEPSDEVKFDYPGLDLNREFTEENRGQSAISPLLNQFYANGWSSMGKNVNYQQLQNMSVKIGGKSNQIYFLCL